MLGVYASGISGAHINPAVTFANCVFRKFPWRKFPGYLVAQVLGAMCASAVVYGNYKSAIDVFEGGSSIRTVPGYSETATAGIFCTYPADFMSRTGMFFSEFIASTILMFCIYALKDDGNIGAGPLTPLGLFFVIFGIGACFGWETGYAINLARDFGPRLVSYMIGYGPEVWRAGGYYFWVSLAGDLILVIPILTTLTDSDGCPLLWLHFRRLAVRYVPVHRRQPHQHAIHGSRTLLPPLSQGVVKHGERALRLNLERTTFNDTLCILRDIQPQMKTGRYEDSHDKDHQKTETGAMSPVCGS